LAGAVEILILLPYFISGGTHTAALKLQASNNIVINPETLREITSIECSTFFLKSVA